MRRPYVSLSAVLSALLCLPWPAAHAQGGSGIALGPGRVLQAAPPRQLSLNAHVSGFLFQPGGLSVAFVGTHDEGGQRVVTAWFADARREAPARSLLHVTGDAPDAPTRDPHVPGIDLVGWTTDGRRLVVRQVDQIDLKSQYVSIDVGVEPYRVRALPDLPTPGEGLGVPGVAWSPDHSRLLITNDGTARDAVGGVESVTLAEIYDPARDETLPVPVPDGCIVWGWRDAGHLQLLRPSHAGGGPTAFLLHDIAAGTDTEIPKPTPWPPPDGVEISLSLSGTNTDPTTPAAPGLTLETKREEMSDARHVAGALATSLWVRRAGAPTALSAIPVGLTPGADDPQAAWSPGGRAVAFVAHDDLFITDLTERDATLNEKMAAGEKLGCDEERIVIESNLKQIGLGLIQYAQDNDEKYPPMDGWHDAVYPYVKNAQVFGFAGVSVVYHAPPGVTMASIPEPATTTLATAETPCARIVLYADGHVKSYDKQGNPFPKPVPVP